MAQSESDHSTDYENESDQQPHAPDRRAYEPVTDENPTPPEEVVDADPTAEVPVRADRDLYVTATRHRAAYHLFADCDHLTDPVVGVDVIDVGEMWQDGLPICKDCERREKVRVMLNKGNVPPNPDPSGRFAPDGGTTVRNPQPNPLGYSVRCFGRFWRQFK